MMKLTMLFCSAVLLAQQGAGTRELFFLQRNRPAAPSTPVPFGLRYSIVQRGEGGQMREVDSSTIFRQGDRIRLQFAANQDGYLYVVAHGSSKQWTLLFPTRTADNYRLRKAEPLVVPETGEIVFDAQPGTERMIVVGSRERVDSLERLIPGHSTVMGTISSAVMGAMQSSGKRDLRVEKVTPQPGLANPEFATYILNAAAGPRSERVMADITLLHK